MLAPWKKSYDIPRQHIKKQRHHFANKGLYSQSYGFSSHHVQMQELNHKEGWAPKNRCFWTAVLEKTLKSPLDCKIKQVNPKGSQAWIFTGRSDIEAEAPITWPADAKSQLIRKDPDAGKDWGQEKGATEDETLGWHHWLKGHEFEQTPGDGEGQGSLACCRARGHRELDMRERRNGDNCIIYPSVRQRSTCPSHCLRFVQAGVHFCVEPRFPVFLRSRLGQTAPSAPPPCCPPFPSPSANAGLFWWSPTWMATEKKVCRRKLSHPEILLTVNLAENQLPFTGNLQLNMWLYFKHTFWSRASGENWYIFCASQFTFLHF